MKQYLELTKFGIVVLVLLCGATGYALGYSPDTPFSITHYLLSMLGLGLLGGGSLALNQAQEHKLDASMERTKKRPIPSGRVSLKHAYVVGITLIAVGLGILYWLKPLAAGLGVINIILYNGFYTYIWKPKMVFGAVPGAVPGAMPVVIAYAINDSNIFSLDCIYLFLVMFLWQMPHFWLLAIKFAKDYKSAGIPVLPSVLGTKRTVFYIGLYTVFYAALALASPWFVDAKYIYFVVVIPFAMLILWEFLKYSRQEPPGNWFRFFMWVNASVLIFLVAPVIDKWINLALTLQGN